MPWAKDQIRLPSFPPDVELMRALILYLETRQLSPRSTIVIALRDEREAFACEIDVLMNALNILLELDYIEGPGQHGDDIWLFRKLTRKGLDFVEAAYEPEDWTRMKRAHEARLSTGG